MKGTQALVTFDTYMAKAVEGQKIKGFVSLNNKDRGGDIVSPETFNVKSFMANPLLLYQHDFWRDESGNPIPAGHVTEMFVAEVVEGNENTYKIKNVESGQIVDEFPKVKAPDLSVGDRGLWATAQVTVKRIWDMIEAGDLNAFSWRGYVTVEYLDVEGQDEPERIIKAVDLFEVSVVMVPGNQRAYFTISKALRMAMGKGDQEARESQSLAVYLVMLSKSNFGTTEDAKTWLRERHMNTRYMSENGSVYMFVQRTLRDFDESSLISIQLAKGVQAIAGYLKDTVEKSNEIENDFNAKLVASDVERLRELTSAAESEIAQENVMSDKATTPDDQEVQNSTDTSEASAEDETTETREEAVEETEKDEQAEAENTDGEEAEADTEEEAESEKAEDTEEQEATDGLPDAVKALIDPLAAGIGGQLKPVLENIADTLKKLVEREEQKAEEAETEGDTEDETEDDEEQAEVHNSQKMLAGLLSLKKALDDTQERLANVERVAQPETVRQEVSKSAETKTETETRDNSDPNDVFDTAFPFMGE